MVYNYLKNLLLSEQTKEKRETIRLIAYFYILALVNRFLQINTNDSRLWSVNFRILFPKEIY